MICRHSVGPVGELGSIVLNFGAISSISDDLRGRLGDPGVGVVGGGVRRRGGCAALPGQERPGAGVLAQQEAQRRRAGAGQPEAEQRRQDLLVVDLRVAPVPVLDREAGPQQSDRLVAEHGHAELVERPGLLGTVEQGHQPLVERLLAQVGEPGPGPRLGDHLVDHRHRSPSLSVLGAGQPAALVIERRDSPAKLRRLASSTSGSGCGTR